jgi:glycosyltransferase involved in cell wall biosynthesis
MDSHNGCKATFPARPAVILATVGRFTNKALKNSINPKVLQTRLRDEGSMPRFSLIIATLSRTTELTQLLESFTRQDFSDYEVILVDQNDDGRLQAVVDAFAGRVPIERVFSPKGVSTARNFGLRKATGEIIAFPDDDCWYSPGLLGKVDQWFRDHKRHSILAVGAVDEEGISSGNRWFQSSCDLHLVNIFRTTFCSSLFIRCEALFGNAFDEEMDRGEETDLVLRILSSGLRGRFDRTWTIGHPRRDMLSGSIAKERARSYGWGMGNVLRKHSLFALWSILVGYDFLRAMVVALLGNFSSASLCFAHAGGLLRGYFMGLGRQESLSTKITVAVPD